MRSSSRTLRAAVFISLLLLISSVISLDGFTLPAGFQEFYVPLPADLARQIFVNIDNDPVVSTGMHYVVGVTASADNTPRSTTTTGRTVSSVGQQETRSST